MCPAGYDAFQGGRVVRLGCELAAGHDQEMHERHDPRRGRVLFADQRKEQ